MGFPVGYSEMLLPRVLLQVLLLLGHLHRFLLWAFHAVGLGDLIDLGCNYPYPPPPSAPTTSAAEQEHQGLDTAAAAQLQHRRAEFRPVPAVLVDEALPVVRFDELAGTACGDGDCAVCLNGIGGASATAATPSTAPASTAGWRTTSAPARSAARRSSPGPRRPRTPGPPLWRRGPTRLPTTTCCPTRRRPCRRRRCCRRCPPRRCCGLTSCCSPAWAASSELRVRWLAGSWQAAGDANPIRGRQGKPRPVLMCGPPLPVGQTGDRRQTGSSWVVSPLVNERRNQRQRRARSGFLQRLPK